MHTDRRWRDSPLTLVCGCMQFSVCILAASLFLDFRVTWSLFSSLINLCVFVAFPTMAGKKNGRKGPRKSQTQPLPLVPMFRTPTSIDHHHVRRWEYGPLGRLAADQGYGFSFALSDLPNSSDFTNMYELYRFDFVELIVEIAALTTSTLSVGSPALPTLIIYPDYTDSTAPSSISVANEVAQSERFTLSAAKPSFARRVKPCASIGIATNTGGTLAGAYKLPAKHFDCVFPSIPHFGIKMFVANYNIAAVEDSGCVLNVSFRYGLTMRNPR